MDDARGRRRRLTWAGGGARAGAGDGDVPADGCERVGTVQIVVPDAPGPLVLTLACSLLGDGEVDNRYEAPIRCADRPESRGRRE